jgi:hypothetical protein
MHLRAGYHLPRPGRLAALAQAALLVLALALAPELHRHNCTGVCAMAQHTALAAQTASVARSADAESGAGHACCHGGTRAGTGAAKAAPGAQEAAGGCGGGSSDGCTCLDDCCTIYALGTTPDVTTDTGPMVLLVSPPPATDPSRPPQAPHARLLPYPNGPPAPA